MIFRNSKNGFTLIETLVGSLVFVLVALAAYRAFGVLMTAVSYSQTKIAATALANEQIEIIRNLRYTDVGIVAGLPAGKIQRTQNITRDNNIFTIQTTIRSVDDPFDGTIGGSPADTSPADYKMVHLDITCGNCRNFTPLKFVTLVAPHALETALNNGALFIQIFDSAGAPIDNAAVHIVNTATNPDTIIDETTDAGGWIRVVDAPPGTNAYNITATKSGFTTDRTYLPGGAAGANPVNPDVTVVVQQVSQTSLSIDRLSSISASSFDALCAPLPNLGFSLTGTKLIGTPSVLKYIAHNFTTNASGTLSIPNLEWDTYNTTLTSASFDLAGTDPFPGFSLNANENKNLKLVAVPHVNRAILISVKNSTGAAIDGATVRLQRSGFDQTKTTGAAGTCPTPGQVFWNGLASGTYTLTISKTGYQTYTNNALSISPSWQHQLITLNP